MNERIKKTVQEYYKYGCSGTILKNYKDIINIDEEEALKKAKPFLGGAKITCGAVLAAHEILKQKAPHKIEKFDLEFKKKNKTTICKELKGLTGGPLLRTCPGCIEDACTILEKLLSE